MPFTLVFNMYEKIHTNVNCMNILQIIYPQTQLEVLNIIPLNQLQKITSVFKIFLNPCIPFMQL